MPILKYCVTAVTAYVCALIGAFIRVRKEVNDVG